MPLLAPPSRTRSAFTLVEMLVAVAILAVLLVIITVPIRLAFDSLSAGRARASAQQAAQNAMLALETELRRAIFVFPNAQLAGVIDAGPYFTVSDTQNFGDCIPSANRADNNGRIDFLLPRRDDNGLTIPVRAEGYVVSYYSRRLFYQSATEPNYDVITNPLTLFRAQMPFLENSNPGAAPFLVAGVRNVEVDLGRRLAQGACGVGTIEYTRGNLWAAQNARGEGQLEVPANASAPGIPAAHTQALGRDLGLFVPNVDATGAITPINDALVPETAFRLEDANGDGKIDRVTIHLAVANYSAVGNLGRGNQPSAQVVRLTRTIDLPNIR